MEDCKSLFKNPPMGCRPAPFWFWNDRLDSARVVEQFDRLIDAGMGGAVLHARHGLDPKEYLDERWFAAVEAVVKRAKERSVYVWLYDELNWPSGTAGGRIPREHPEFRMLHLRLFDTVLEQSEDLETLPGNFIAAFVVTRTDPCHGFQRRHDGSVVLLPDRISCTKVSDRQNLKSY
ncbi:MAG: hypothetical protein HY706_03825, partial [Candidatus Hydrogenedentes bacterium]|nr:hypothetical protein [Candidatus Hydrogenedentota bacterium]